MRDLEVVLKGLDGLWCCAMHRGVLREDIVWSLACLLRL